MSSKTPNTQVKPKKIGKNKRKKEVNSILKQADSAPLSKSIATSSSAPQIRRSPNGTDISISHKEFLGNIVDSVNFSIRKTVQLNPGLPDSFPWLSKIARQFEYYRFSKLRFVFLTRSPATRSGSLILAPDYDAADLAPLTENQITAFKDCHEDVVWKDQICPLTPRDMFAMGPKKFVRGGAVPTGSDIKTYDAGAFFVAISQGVDNVTALGKLWVEYDVHLSVPQLDTESASSVSIQATSGLTSLIPWGTTPVVNKMGLPFGDLNAAGNRFTFSRNFSGLLETSSVGTTLTDMFATGTITAPVMTDVINAAGTNGIGILPFTALAGSYLGITNDGAATLTKTITRILEYDYKNILALYPDEVENVAGNDDF